MICGLILAAGEGRRFGAEPKLLAALDGRPLLEHAIGAMVSVAELQRVVVVLGHRADEVRASVRFGRAEPVVCFDWTAGQSASLRCGAEALAGSERVIVTLGDVPGVSGAVIRRFVEGPVPARATYRGRPGHPVVLGPAQLEALAELSGDVGARELLHDAVPVECADLATGADVDTPDDLLRLRASKCGSS